MTVFTSAALLAALAIVARAHTPSKPDLSRCEAAARTETGWVCGARRRAVSGSEYASFLAVPYAKQPLGELRFQELLPAEPWDNIREAKVEGPVCPQTDVFYGRIKTASGGMSEACIHANIHVPIEALPDPKKPPSLDAKAAPGLPILVFIHGGGFAFGSGDTDLHGPEYLVSKGVIVITFNYRLNVFGFLSLNSTQVPGNAGLRDTVTLLRWVQRNARFFGGSPGAVTLAGQSAGASMAQILTLSTGARSLFRRAILLSFSDYFSPSAQFVKTINSLFFPLLGINATLPADEIHQKLIETPINEIMDANKKLIDLFGVTTFTPIVESYQPGITPILEDDPEVLLDSGRGRDIPLLIGFTDAECESFRPRFEQIDIVGQIEKTPALVVSPRLTFLSGDQLPVVAELIYNKYFNDTLDLDGFLRLCTDQFYKYPAFKLASKTSGETPVFMYRFSYGGVDSAWKEGLGLKFEGAGHVEDLTYIFRTNSVLGPLGVNESTRRDDDAKMKNKMSDIIVNFMKYSHPMPGPLGAGQWPKTAARRPPQYLEANGPKRIFKKKNPTSNLQHCVYKSIYAIQMKMEIQQMMHFRPLYCVRTH
ncbi:unnamed protein product [Chilo suppressalis]|uniref:Carboxylic ester hydrolase n=1 Tax=Chilo suppressalis TaxID=168631 RepID=A0ABN8B4Z1_CHISP|nr:unnamed protein product [Chilo suppressalis]